MEPRMAMYVAYVAISVGMTVWVAQTLFRNGRVFLVDVFAGNEKLADSVNHLLVVGFYLVNLGYVSLALRTDDPVGSPSQAVEALSWKVGIVLLVLGAMHFMNLLIFSKSRRGALDRAERAARDAARSVPPPLPALSLPPLASAPDVGGSRG